MVYCSWDWIKFIVSELWYKRLLMDDAAKTDRFGYFIFLLYNTQQDPFRPSMLKVCSDYQTSLPVWPWGGTKNNTSSIKVFWSGSLNQTQSWATPVISVCCRTALRPDQPTTGHMGPFQCLPTASFLLNQTTVILLFVKDLHPCCLWSMFLCFLLSFPARSLFNVCM